MISTYLTAFALATTVAFIIAMAVFNTRFLKAEREKEDKYKFLIGKLWNIVDDIDTYSDVAKSDDMLYRQLVEMKQRERWELVGISLNKDVLEYNLGAIHLQFEDSPLMGGDGKGLLLKQAFNHIDDDADVSEKDVVGLTTDVSTGLPVEGIHWDTQEVADAYKLPVETLMPVAVTAGEGLKLPEAPSITLLEIKTDNAVKVYGPITSTQEDGFMKIGTNLYLKNSMLYRKEGDEYIEQKMQVVDASSSEEAPLAKTAVTPLYGTDISARKMWLMLSESLLQVCIPPQATHHCLIILSDGSEFICHAKSTN
jgi:hypothetical protein